MLTVGRFLKLWALMTVAVLAVYALKRLFNLNQTMSVILGGLVLWLIGTAAYAWLRRR